MLDVKLIHILTKKETIKIENTQHSIVSKFYSSFLTLTILDLQELYMFLGNSENCSSFIASFYERYRVKEDEFLDRKMKQKQPQNVKQVLDNLKKK